MKFWRPVSLIKNFNEEVILIFEFMNTEIRITSTVQIFEVILILEFMHSEIRITSTFIFARPTGCRTFRISFRKTSYTRLYWWPLKINQCRKHSNC